MLNKVSEWRVNALDAARDKGVGISFDITAIHSKKDGGFVVFAAIDGKGGIFVSSQRQDRRVFKTLDALRRAMIEVGISSFSVVG